MLINKGVAGQFLLLTASLDVDHNLTITIVVEHFPTNSGWLLHQSKSTPLKKYFKALAKFRYQSRCRVRQWMSEIFLSALWWLEETTTQNVVTLGNGEWPQRSIQTEIWGQRGQFSLQVGFQDFRRILHPRHPAVGCKHLCGRPHRVQKVGFNFPINSIAPPELITFDTSGQWKQMMRAMVTLRTWWNSIAWFMVPGI